jgi:hypothetical protein
LRADVSELFREVVLPNEPQPARSRRIRASQPPRRPSSKPRRSR